ncbi:MAG: pyridoxal phosphate-dependent aminotransferase [Nitrospiria bacterium]
MKLAARLQNIQASPTMAVAAKAKALMARGIDITLLGLGEPDFPSPEVASEAAIEAVRAGFTKYTPPSGTDELKTAILQKLKRDNGLEYEKNEIIVSCGAKHTLYNIAQVLFEAGDEVIVPAPYWVSYPDQILLAGATPVFIETKETNGFLITPDQLKKAIGPNTKGLILNSPSNPTGRLYRREHYEALTEILLETDLTIISDEIYEKFLYDGAEHVSIASLHPELKRKTIVVNGVSKAYSMTGWRIGYAAGPKGVVAAMSMVQSQSTSNPASISQKAAVAALQEGGAFIDGMVSEFEKRRNIMVRRLNGIKGIQTSSPAGSFYLFPNVKESLGKAYKNGPIQNAIDLATYLLEEGGVATVPGEAFGAPGYLRISYASPIEILSKGLDKIEQALSKLS